VTSLDLAFTASGVLAAAAAVLAVATRHVVHAALWLVVALLGVAGCLLVLGAELVALVLVLVYVGAVVVLVLFALMLTRAPIGPDRTYAVGPARRAAAAACGAATTALLLAVLLPAAGEAVPRRAVSSTQVAGQLFGTWVWPFEALSVLLLAALVAALAVSRLPRATGRAADADPGTAP
jgi:NADH-quinone oxidoreductase subunit J